MARSHLYVPGDRDDLLAKALGRGADALIVDLEDAVAPAAKDAARVTVAAFVAQGRPVGSPAIWVRLNSGEDALTDLDAVVAPGLAGVCVAKAENAAEIEAVAARLEVLEAAHGVPTGAIAICPLLESANAVLDALAIARAPRVARLQVGEADLSAELGVDLGADERELLWARSQVVLASSAAGIDAPVGPVSTNFRDLEALRRSTESLRRMGYRGRACIHPAQLAVVNEVFTPTPEQVERARALVDRFDAAVAAGAGACADEDGRMIDLAVVRSARRVLENAG